MKKKLKCLNCGSEDLVLCQNVSITKQYKINKNLAIAKKFKYLDNHSITDGYAFIFCNQCGISMDYEDDSNGKIIELVGQ